MGDATSVGGSAPLATWVRMVRGAAGCLGGLILTLQGDRRERHLRAGKNTAMKKLRSRGAIRFVYLCTNKANLPIVSRRETKMGNYCREFFSFFFRKNMDGEER